ncbi:MAG: hypothetical protein DRN27_09060, partial [Thermoplasmata archaeon]
NYPRYGSASTPITYSDGKLYYKSGISQSLICVDADVDTWAGAGDDALIWISGVNPASSAIVVNDFVYITSFNGVDTNVVCLNKNNGNVEWETPLNASFLFGDFVFDDEKIYVTADEDLFCINAEDGEIIWQTLVITAMDDSFSACGNTPTISEGKLYAISLHGTIYCLDLEDEGNTLWEFVTGEFTVFESPSIAYEKLYVGTSESFYCLDPVTPNPPEWTINEAGKTPIVADGKVYVRIEGLKCLDAINGTVIWQYSEIGNSCPVIANDILYYSSQGTIYLFRSGNQAPGMPSISGPSEVLKNTPYSYFVNSTDPDEDMIIYKIDWDLGVTEEFGPVPSGEEQEIVHIFRKPHSEGEETLEIKVIAKEYNTTDELESLEAIHYTHIENHAPDAPIVNGPEEVYVGESFSVEFSVFDSDNDGNLALGIKEGSLGTWEWSGNYDSGETFQKTFTIGSVGIKDFHFKVGERGSENGNVFAKSEEVNYSIDVIAGVVEISNVKSKIGSISVEITETSGLAKAVNVQCDIEASGGVMDLFSSYSEYDEFDELAAGEMVNVETWGFIIGLGCMNVNISVNAAGMDPITKTMKAFVIGPFIIGLREVQ